MQPLSPSIHQFAHEFSPVGPNAALDHEFRSARALLEKRFPTVEVFAYLMRLDGRAERIL